MCKKHFTVVASWGVILTSLNAAKYLNPLVPNLGMGAPPKGQNINLKGLGMINERQKKEKKNNFYDFWDFFCNLSFFVKYWIIWPRWFSNIWNETGKGPQVDSALL